MSKTAKEQKLNRSTDLVLQEIRRAKDELSASYGHDINRLFAGLREREKTSGHPLVNLQNRRPAKASRRTKGQVLHRNPPKRNA